jgi:two-component system, cell cycle sensor histidine kinase and response regulator CckA
MGNQGAGRDRSGAQQIHVSGIHLEWHPEQGTCTFERLPVAMMWVDTTLAGLMSGVQAMVGTARFLLALQSEGRKSVEPDWQVISRFPDFRQGFEAIANIAAVAGWGDWELTALDAGRQEGRFRVRGSWEGRYQKALGVCWGSGMLAGKLAGYCSKLFGANCWADQTAFSARGDPYDEFTVRPSPRSVEKEIERLLASDEATRADMEVALRTLEKEIAERRRAEEALRESEEKFRSLVETTTDWIWETAADGTYIYSSPSVRDLLGYEPVEVIGRKPFDFMPPDEAGRVAAEFAHISAERRPFFSLENLNLHKDGRRVILDTSGVPRLDPQGHLLGYRGIDRDITERKRAEAALQQSEEKYRVLVENAGEAISVAQEGKLRFANRKTEELTGYTHEELLSRPLVDFIHPDDRAMVLDRHVKRQQGVETPSNYQFRLAHKSGDTRWVDLNVVMIEWEGKSASLNFLTDVTERRLAEAALQKSQTLFASVFRASPAATILSTLADGRCVDANEAYCRLTGYTREELVGHTTTELNIWISSEERQRVVTELTKHQHLEDVEITIRTKSGAFRKTVAGGETLAIEGQRYILSFFYDITERKRAEAERFELERQLLHTQKLESLGILAGGIAHDFNNLLMAILGNLDLALLNASQVSPARVNIERALQATRRATDLTRQLLAYSGKGHFVVTRIDLNELVRESANLFRTAIAKTVTMHLHLSAEPSAIEADPGQVQQVIINLITNASEAIADRPGTITLTTGSADCDETYLSKSRLSEKPSPGPFVYLEVSDTGCGMNEETLQRLFDPFFTTKFMGRGLGMSAVLGIVRGHKGAIMVESTIGQGTTIRALFPASAAGPLGKAEASSASPRLAGMGKPAGTVLVVDDEEAVRAVAIAFVQRLGFQTISAADGEEALRLFEEHAGEISCILLDLTMPRMDGLSTFRQMRRLRPDVKVILCSGYDEHEATKRFTSEGLSGFIQKPYNLRNLGRIIAQVLEGSP